MSSRTTLRLAIVIHWLSIVVGVAVSFPLEAQLPEILQHYLVWDMDQAVSSAELFILLIGLVFIVVSLVGSVGLFLFRIWGRNLFIVSSIAMLSLGPFLGPTVEHALESVFSSLESISEGLILALVLFTKALNNVQNGP